MQRCSFCNRLWVALFALEVQAFFVEFLEVPNSAFLEVGKSLSKVMNCFYVTVFESILSYICLVLGAVVCVRSALSPSLLGCRISMIRYSAQCRLILRHSKPRFFMCGHVSRNEKTRARLGVGTNPNWNNDITGASAQERAYSIHVQLL